MCQERSGVVQERGGWNQEGWRNDCRCRPVPCQHLGQASVSREKWFEFDGVNVDQ